MPPVSVVTDSTSYLPAEVLERHGIHVVPLYIVFGGDRTVPETDITDYHAFFEELRAAQSLPTTSQPSVGDFTSVYEPLLADGGEVVSVHISGGLSGHAGVGAARSRDADPRGEGGRAGARVRLHDRRRGPRPDGPRRGEARAAAGTPAAEIVARLGEARGELRLWFAIDTLEFLRRGGRIGAASAWIGSTLRVKPILTVQNEMTPVERVRTSSRAFERMVDYLRQCHESGADGLVRPAHQRPRGPRPARGARPGDLRPRAQRLERDRPGARHAHGTGPARRGRAPARVPLLAPRPGRPGAKGQSRGARASREDDRPHGADHRRRRGLSLPALPGAQAAHVDLHRGLPGRRALGPGGPALASHAARHRDRGGVRGPAPGADRPDRADRAAVHHRGQPLRREPAEVLAPGDATTSRTTTGCGS